MDSGNFPLNIPVDGAGDNQQNNPNSPVWTQITAAFVHAIVPFVGAAFLGYAFNQDRLKSEALDSAGYQKNFRDLNRLSSLLKQVETEQNVILNNRQLYLKERYDDILDILDIACSPFTPKWNREPLQENLIKSVNHPHSILLQLKMTEGLFDIFNHDSRFAGSGKYDNGKLWRVYKQLWEERAEKIKYEKIVEALKKNLPES